MNFVCVVVKLLVTDKYIKITCFTQQCLYVKFVSSATKKIPTSFLSELYFNQFALFSRVI
jgi:hypothetical protein